MHIRCHHKSAAVGEPFPGRSQRMVAQEGSAVQGISSYLVLVVKYKCSRRELILFIIIHLPVTLHLVVLLIFRRQLCELIFPPLLSFLPAPLDNATFGLPFLALLVLFLPALLLLLLLLLLLSLSRFALLRLAQGTRGSQESRGSSPMSGGKSSCFLHRGEFNLVTALTRPALDASDGCDGCEAPRQSRYRGRGRYRPRRGRYRCWRP
jgi:hypothetical protein